MNALDQTIFAALAAPADDLATLAREAQKFADDLAAAHFTPANDWDAFDAACASCATVTTTTK